MRRVIAGKSKSPKDYILYWSFNGNVLDQSPNVLNGIKTGTANYDTGRKAGTQSINFVSGCVKTPSNLPIGTDKVSISFWLKQSSTSLGALMELSSNSSTNLETFGIIRSINTDFRDRSVGGTNYIIESSSIFSSWTHVVFTIDRSLGAFSENTIYLNGELSTTSVRAKEGGGDPQDLSGNFGNFPLFVGQRNAGSVPFTGNLQDIKIYRRVLTASEIRNLYKE